MRDWLRNLLTPIGLAVYDQPLVVAPTGDFMYFNRFPSRTDQITFGEVGAVLQTTYTPEILICLTDPSNQYPQHVLDAYTEQVRDAINNAPSGVTLTDPVTGATSTLTQVLTVNTDPAPANLLTATVIRATLEEYTLRTA
jgi:hypothetical protein